MTEKKIKITCGDCGVKFTTTEVYKDCKYCILCAVDRNDRARAKYNGERAMYTFYRLKDEGVF